MSNNIYRASLQDLDLLVPLFDAYRQFYKQASDMQRAHTFLTDRIRQQQSVIFIAVSDQNTGLGFTQLYPSFSSVGTARSYILNDLFVSEHARRQGIAKQLLNQATAFCREDGALSLSLSTQTGNNAARKLYESMGWQQDEEFYVYKFRL